MQDGRGVVSLRTTLGIFLVLGTLVAAPHARAEDDEHSIDRSALPAQVERTLVEVSAGATFHGLSSETKDGRTFYEAELTISGRSKDILIDASGAIVETEEEIALDSLPAPVRDALLARATKAQIERIESITSSGSVVAYEAHIKRASKRVEIKVDPKGRVIDPPK